MDTLKDKLIEINRQGVTQEEIARSLDVSLSTVNRWLNGKFKPSIHLENRVLNFIKEIKE